MASVACRSLTGHSTSFIAVQYFFRLGRVIDSLLTGSLTAAELSQTLHYRTLAELQAAQTQSSILQRELAGECSNGRLLQLLIKMACINERPEFDNDQKWAEHGDRYPIKLFRDYCFHQLDVNGHHFILGCLDKVGGCDDSAS